jgi:hypothetical protein
MMPMAQLAAAEASCTRVLEGATSEPDRQKAAFFRALMRFLQEVQKGMALELNADGSIPEYRPPRKDDVAAAFADIETAVMLKGAVKERRPCLTHHDQPDH